MPFSNPLIVTLTLVLGAHASPRAPLPSLASIG